VVRFEFFKRERLLSLGRYRALGLSIGWRGDRFGPWGQLDQVYRCEFEQDGVRDQKRHK
tara:strand:- start:73 stop:249 length:177 start_codon:yes stop_codon:yes gene_type:complete